MNKEVDENWINTYIKDNPFSFKKTIIHHCRQMDKADVYEWVAEDEIKIIQLKEKVKQLELNRDKAIKLIEDTYYSKNTTDIDNIVLSNNKFIKIREILKEVKDE